ncbi:MAG: hypothetical protein Q4C13_03435, partial [Clostridia bacterium]|nr:hypothetical protein [Clostridia bacterium]
METTSSGERRAYHGAQRWLLLAALALGLVWDQGWHGGSVWHYGLFWGLYLVVFYAFQWRALAGNRLCWALAAAAAALCLRTARSDTQPMLLVCAAIPLVLMTHAVFATAEIPRQREGMAVPLALKGFFVKPFTAIPAAFGAFASLFSRQGGSRARRVLLGLAIGLPLTAVVLALLAAADTMMGSLIGGWLENGWRAGRAL